MSELNPGIVKTVALLREWGYDTCDSGDGKTHDFECDRDCAYVVMVVHNQYELVAQANILRAMLCDRGVDLQQQPTMPFLQASYCPVDHIAVLDLNGVDDAMLFGGRDE